MFLRLEIPIEVIGRECGVIQASAVEVARAVTEEMGRRHLSMQELADREGVALQTVRAWRVRGEGPRGMRVGGKFVRYRLQDILEWEEKQLEPR